MRHETETIIARENLPETKDLFDITGKIPPDKLYGVLQFVRGVSYGMSLETAEHPAAGRPSP